MANDSRKHTEWLSLVEVSGPFLSVTTLEKAFPQGLETVATRQRQKLRKAYEEWRVAVDEDDPQLAELHQEWVRLVLEDLLEYDHESLVPATAWPEGRPVVSSADGSGSFEPDWIIKSPGDGQTRLFVAVLPPGTDIKSTSPDDDWPVTLHERLTMLCREHNVRLGLITDGECWMLVNAPQGSVSGYTAWYARLWFQELTTLKAFQSLLGVRCCCGPFEDSLGALLDDSLKHYEEITDTLGGQVRRAVEVLIQCLDQADADRDRELLRDVPSPVLYEAGLTVMMRLVFVLCAEERGLLLLGDPTYDQSYAVSTLRAQLAEEADRTGPEVLDRRYDAWARLLAIFRAVYGGIEHESLRMPALGGSLFDPDRFPFLEGRDSGTSWRDTPAAPLPIDNRTVLLLLNSLQILEQAGGGLLLSYRALDVEQIGHIYEGLLEYTVVRVQKTALGLIGSKKAKNPNQNLADLESAKLDDPNHLITQLVAITGRGEAAIRNSLGKPVKDKLASRLLDACGGDACLTERIIPFANLLRTDAWDYPIVYREKSLMITLGAARRETGTHYTPKSLTESIVATTLEPLVYIGPAEGLPKSDWTLKSSRELLALKICDPAMGSGAFLVQVCRYLGEKLTAAWSKAEAAGKSVTIDGEVIDELGASEPLPTSLDERLTVARRLIAERCLYGVDVNPLAVELAKLSLWLVTLAKDRPFGFLDHHLRFGDSLLGVHDLKQLTCFNLKLKSSSKQGRLFGQNIEATVKEALALRQQILTISVRDIRDVEAMTSLNLEAGKKLAATRLIADTLVGESLCHVGKEQKLNEKLDDLAMMIGEYLNGNETLAKELVRLAQKKLAEDVPEGKATRKPFHWTLEFPEVFLKGGFDGIVGNPPFKGGQKITGDLGTVVRNYLVTYIAEGQKGSADLVAYFFLRAYSLLRSGGLFGLLAVNTIAEGDSRQVGLEALLKKGEATIYAAYPNEPWPGSAAVVTSRVHIRKGPWLGERNLSGHPTAHISAFLSDQDDWSPHRLKANEGISFQGSIVLGMGFVLTNTEAQKMLDADPRNADVIFRYLNGEDLNSDPEQNPSRWVINFWDWPEARAQKYLEPYEWIKKYVYPERLEKSQETSYKKIMKKWWQHLAMRPALYHAIGRGYHFVKHPKSWMANMQKFPRVLLVARVSKTLAFSFVDADSVLSDQTVVFSFYDDTTFALLQSSIHAAFAWQYSSRLKNDLRYTPSEAFETFPFPNKSDPKIYHDATLASLGAQFHQNRALMMLNNQIGLTNFYKKFHSPKKISEKIVNLRNLYCHIDNSIANAYGWDDLNLDHGFHAVPYLPENMNVRFTISEQARLEVLRRLTALNKQRYEEEVKQGLHKKQSPKRATKQEISVTGGLGF